MKQLVLIFCFTLSFYSFSQNSVEKKVGEFSTVKVYDLINLKLIKSKENKVVISGKNKSDVEILNKNGKLKIRMKLKESYDGSDTVVTLYYTNLDVIDANEGAKVIVEDTIKQYEIDLRAQEGAEITADINVNYANYRAVTGGIINTTGMSKNQDITIYTGGIYNGKSFKTERTAININAAGEAYINASQKVVAKVKAGGNIYIYGDPKHIEETTVIGGTIKRM